MSRDAADFLALQARPENSMQHPCNTGSDIVPEGFSNMRTDNVIPPSHRRPISIRYAGHVVGRWLPALPHPFVKVAGGENALGVLPIQPLIVGDISKVPKFHRRPCPLHSLGKIPHRRAVAEHGIDPFVLEPVRQLPKHREDVSEALGQGTINVIFDGTGVAQTGSSAAEMPGSERSATLTVNTARSMRSS